MSLPVIFCIDDDPHVLRVITQDLKEHYREDYRIMGTTVIQEALDTLLDLRNKGESIALLLSDQQMPEMEGVVFLGYARKFFPMAKRVLLTAYADKDAAIKAINTVQLDYYLMKPWDPPEEKLYPLLDGLLNDWQSTYRPTFTGIKIIGYQYSQQSHELKDFLAGNLVPYQWVDIHTTEHAEEMLSLNGLTVKDLPVVIFSDGVILSKPGIQDVAAKIGLRPELKNEV
ncbi:response regulator [Mucilaginibacter aquariorum]|uniref:Response regulator n=1 Tax=Mucilaginibacter aquariorum TaxID=2967225 RepID=A0ABT1SXG4_9SPHI|nr:response regulator [Mucilaginibacter aquariorum]MCQ6957029.1 response regulator [Mucilaginibacter aquariorum]